MKSNAVRGLLIGGMLLALPPGAHAATAQSALTKSSGSASSASGQGSVNLGKHDTNAPINVTANDFVGDFDTKVGTYLGDVVVTQADYKLKADKVKVETLKGEPNKFFANGNVVFVSASGVATGDNGIYDMNPPRTITMTGNVILTKQKDVMRGTLLVVNLVTGESHLTAHGMPGNRVTTLFVPKPHPAANKPGQPLQK